MKNSIQIQGDALREIDPSGEKTLNLISEYACTIRDIIETFEAEKGRLPDGHEIVWILGERIGKNPKDDANSI